jgi:hypothetical protein
MFNKIRLVFVVLVATFCAAIAIPTIALAQADGFVGTWRGQQSSVGPAGYTVVMSMEFVFQPNGKYSSLSSSTYANGPVAGGQVGAMQAEGTFTVDAAQGLISFHADRVSTTEQVTVQKDETDHFQFLSPTMFQFQSMIGGPPMTFQRVQ